MSDEIMKVVISNLDPVNRYPTVSKTFEGLDHGEKLELVNDHDLQHLLKYKFSEDFPDQYDYIYLEEGPEVWRVMLTKR
jgi:uncharacterized protein (DUF2249 family)